jgi:glucuronoarabinoxylan endo-1,4-beta-xylanase
MRTLIILLTLTTLAAAQYKIPFASKGNRIELTVANSAGEDLNGVTVTAAEYPQWIDFKETTLTLSTLASETEEITQFEFSVEKDAEIGKKEIVKFVISNGGGNEWEKEIEIEINPPEKYELYQNYPNPANPATIIGYQLPFASEVTLKIYDVLGREIAILVKGVQEAGYHKTEWNALNYSSGMYICRLTAEGKKGKRFASNKKIMVLK